MSSRQLLELVFYKALYFMPLVISELLILSIGIIYLFTFLVPELNGALPFYGTPLS